MRNLVKLSLAGAAVAGIALACGSSSNSGPADAGVTLTGSGTTSLQILPQAQAVLGASFDLGDMTKFQVDLIDPIQFLLAGEVPARLGNSPVTPTNPTANHADYKVTGVDSKPLAAPSLTPGLVVNVLDTNATKKQTTPTSTGVIALVPNGTFPAAKDLVADAPAFIIPDAFADILAQLALGAGKTHADLGAGGYILALVIDRTTGTAVSGATLDETAIVGTGHTVTYPNFSGATPTKGAATDATGLIIITGPPTGTSPIQLTASTGTLPTCATSTSTNCLVPASAGLTTNIAFVAPIVKH